MNVINQSKQEVENIHSPHSLRILRRAILLSPQLFTACLLFVVCFGVRPVTAQQFRSPQAFEAFINTATEKYELSQDQRLDFNEYLISENGKYYARILPDGNFVIREMETGFTVRETGPDPKPNSAKKGYFLFHHSGPKLVLFRGNSYDAGQIVTQFARTGSGRGAYRISNQGRLEFVDTTGRLVWFDPDFGSGKKMHQEVRFYKRDDFGDRMAIASTKTGLNEDLTKSSFANNDDIRSVLLWEVPAGVVLELWDSSNDRDSDDWVRMTTTAPGTYRIPYLERNPNLPGLKYERFGNGNLAGKVSRVTLESDPVTVAGTQAIESMYAWGFKHGQAHEFRINDSNFRVWKPVVSYTASGATAVFKLDHIRGAAADDHAAVVLQFDSNGKLVMQKTDISIAGKHPIVKVMTARDEAVKAAAAAAPDDPKSQALAALASMATGMQAALIEALEESSEKGGRLLFPGVVHAQTMKVGSVLADAIVENKSN